MDKLANGQHVGVHCLGCHHRAPATLAALCIIIGGVQSIDKDTHCNRECDTTVLSGDNDSCDCVNVHDVVCHMLLLVCTNTACESSPVSCKNCSIERVDFQLSPL